MGESERESACVRACASKSKRGKRMLLGKGVGHVKESVWLYERKTTRKV